MATYISHVRQQKPPKRVFFAAAIMIFFTSLSAADSIGFVPYYIDGSAPRSARVADVHPELPLTNLPELGPVTAESPVVSTLARIALPERITIAAIGLDLPVQNPSTRDIVALDTLLQKGPARYVDSARLGESGNMIIFAHSSHLPIVHNQMYRAFNKIPELKAGDTIVLESGGTEYLYSVTSLRQADATDTMIDLSATQGTKLTLVTCDTLTGKSARFILEADFVGTVGARQ